MRNSFFKGVMLCKSPFSAFPSPVRTYFTQTKVPQMINDRLKETLPDKFSVKMSTDAWKKSATDMVQYLQNEIKINNCFESKAFLSSLVEFVKDDKCRGLEISNMPPSPASQMLINAIFYSVGYGFYFNQRTSNPFIVDGGINCDELPPHTDQTGDERMAVFALNAEYASGKVSTNFLSPYVIMEKNILTDRQIDILSQPSFFFSNYTQQKSQAFAIISNKDGKLRVNFDADIKGFGCDFNLNKYPEEEVKEAVRTFYKAVCKIFIKENEVIDTVNLSTGKAVVAKNDLHHRPSFIEPGRLLTRTYGEAVEETPLVLQLTSPKSLTYRAQAIKVDLQSALGADR